MLRGESSVFFKRYGKSDLVRLLQSPEAYHPFPTVQERGAWEALSEGLRQAAIVAGEGLLGLQWPQLPATLHMDYARTGDRQRYEGPYFRRRSALNRLVIAECVEGEGRFLDDVINGIWAMCEESNWEIPAAVPPYDSSGAALPDTANPWIGLFDAETAALLSWAHYLLGSRLDAVETRICDRIRREVKFRLLDPFLARDDFWWMGLHGRRRPNNWNPWCTSNCLVAFLLLEQDSQRRNQAVAKAMRVLERFVGGYDSDGGCDEGYTYWSGAAGRLFDCLELLRTASGGKIDFTTRALIREMGRYIYRVHISKEHYANFADARARHPIPAGLVYRYGVRVRDPELAALGSCAYHDRGSEALLDGALLRVLPNLFDTRGIEDPAEPPYPRDVWLKSIQVMAAREREGSDRGLYLAAKGGHNDESHNHNDVGQYLVYFDGQPVIVDVGVGAYSRQTFSDQRYELWTMQSAYHSLPTVNGVQQHQGKRFRASAVSYRADDSLAELTLSIAGAYPRESGIRSWQRTSRLVRGGQPCVEIIDDFELGRASQDIALSVMTPCQPESRGPGIIGLSTPTGELHLTFDQEELTAASVEPIPLDDPWLQPVWGERLFRITLRPQAPTARARWTIRVESGGG